MTATNLSQLEKGERMRPMPELEVVKVPTADLLEYQNNAKEHPLLQVDQIAASIEQFGFNNPILAWHNDDGEPEIVAGHGRLMAARKLGLQELPVVFLDHMSEEQRRAYILVDNQLTMNSGFDIDILQSELDKITSIDMSDFDFEIVADQPNLDEEDMPDLEEVGLRPFEKVHYLITVDINKNDEVIDAIMALQEVDGVEVKTTLN